MILFLIKPLRFKLFASYLLMFCAFIYLLTSKDNVYLDTFGTNKVLPDDVIPSFTLCNGFSNQVIILLSNIGLLTTISNDKALKIPDDFLASGTPRKASNQKVMEIAKKSVHLAKLFAPDDISRITNYSLEVASVNKNLSCYDWLNQLQISDPTIVYDILRRIKPSTKILQMIDSKIGLSNLENTICFHHRDGQDWHDHCQQWENINDGAWRGNCREPYNKKIGALLSIRIASNWNGNNKSDMVLYYVGDHKPPISELLKIGFRKIITHEDLLGKDGDKTFFKEVFGDANKLTRRIENNKEVYQNVRRVLDYLVCSKLKRFVGNSVSIFSALQISMRNGYASWYNSHYIPIGGIINIPIVFTYTEGSALVGQVLLKVSILSVRRHLGKSQQIHILYHELYNDLFFKSWLKLQGVILHAHIIKQEIQEIFEVYRRNGDQTSSHLFSHGGNYLGTWQRIDIPDFIEAEYCMYLDADTLVISKFTFASFTNLINTLNFTIAFALEREEFPKMPWNAGVALMNVPKLRESKKKFLEFILQGSNVKRSAPSDQGAYIDFYNPVLLEKSFNIKPYFSKFDMNTKIIHFHGLKPHEWLNVLIGERVSPTFKDLVGIVFPIKTKRRKNKKRKLMYHSKKIMSAKKTLCFSLLEFSKTLKVGSILTTYCKSSFQDLYKVKICENFFDQIHYLTDCATQIEQFGLSIRDIFLSKKSQELNIVLAHIEGL